MSVLAQHPLDAPVEFGTVQIVEHLRDGHEDDALGLGASLVREGSGKECLASARIADEEWIDALVEKRQVMQCEVARLQLTSHRVEVEVETIDGVDLGEACIADATGDGAIDPTGFLG